MSPEVFVAYQLALGVLDHWACQPFAASASYHAPCFARPFAPASEHGPGLAAAGAFGTQPSFAVGSYSELAADLDGPAAVADAGVVVLAVAVAPVDDVASEGTYCLAFDPFVGASVPSAGASSGLRP